MSKKLEQEHPERERPKLPETPFLCASCRHGIMLLQKLPMYSRSERKENPGLPADAFWWDWEARCNSSQVAGKEPETFYFPIVDCEGFESREIGSTESSA